MVTVFPIPAFLDNYIWVLHRKDTAWVVDPGDAAPVLAALKKQGLRLGGVLVTHHHGDHIGGLPQLLRGQALPVFGPRAESATIPQLTRLLDDGDRVDLPDLGLSFEVLTVPGHTLGHIAYFCAEPGRREPPILLCGDTLFSAGCGRLFEGTPAQMHASLARLAALPPETRVYCTHEYTLANLAFAATVEPGNVEVRDAQARLGARRSRGEPTLPSTLERELSFNPFLRCTVPAVAQAAERRAGASLPDAAAVFAELRRWKDSFKAPPEAIRT